MGASHVVILLGAMLFAGCDQCGPAASKGETPAEAVAAPEGTPTPASGPPPPSTRNGPAGEATSPENDSPEKPDGPAMAEVAQFSFDGAPEPRMDHVAVFTGTHLVVWGGDDAFPSESDGYADVRPHPLASGGRYDPVADAWQTMTTRGAPPPSYGATAVYTGTEMVVWGGQRGEGRMLRSGGRYDPTRDSWRPIAGRGAPSARAGHTMTWTGSEVLIWGGKSGGATRGDGARYNPESDEWTAMGGAGAPSRRANHSAAWTGSELIVWGGAGPAGDLGDGARYDPATDRWQAMDSQGAPSARHGHVAVFSGEELIVWGGQQGDWKTRDRRVLADGALYDPAADRWRPMSQAQAHGRDYPVGVWTGTHLAVLGEVDLEEDLYPPPSLGFYDPRKDEWSVFGGPEAIGCPLVAGRGELLLWSGTDGTNLMADGSRILLPPALGGR